MICQKSTLVKPSEFGENGKSDKNDKSDEKSPPRVGENSKFKDV